MKIKKAKLKKKTLKVAGTHCPSCAILIEKKLLEKKEIESAKVSLGNNEVLIGYRGDLPEPKKLSRLFKKDGYSFFEKKDGSPARPDGQKLADFITIIGLSLLVILAFFLLKESGFSALLSVNSQSALPAFLIFGLLAGFSTCSALVGGIILSMSRQWSSLYSASDSNWHKFQPHLMFNIGRLMGYLFFGALLGVLGSVIRVSPVFTSILTMAVSVLMVFLALPMLGIEFLDRFQLTLPKVITRFVVDEKNFRGKRMPFLMGALTFFLPCGFTITAQGVALLAGQPLQASLIMLFFALGTLPALLMIGFSSLKLTQEPGRSGRLLKMAGVLVLFFAFYNFNSQLNVLGLASLSDFGIGQTLASDPVEGLPPVVGGKQILKMDALAGSYEPDVLKVRAGVPVRWEITDRGTSGCTNAVISKNLFSGQIDLVPGQTSVKEFTPNKPGRYKFSCWMGMVVGTIVVVDEDGSAGSFDETILPTNGISPVGCGGDCGGSCGGSCGSTNCPYYIPEGLTP